MNVRAVAVVLALFGLAAMMGEAGGQVLPNYRGPPAPAADDDDLAPLSPGPPGPYGRPSTAPYPYDAPPQRPPSAIQRDALPALPPPGQAQRDPYYAPPYQDGAVPAPYGRGLTYGPWEPIRPPGDIYGPNYGAPSYGPNYGAPNYGPNYGAPAAPGGRPYNYGDRGPPDAPGAYSALPPDYQPERGQPKELPPQFRRQMVDYPTREPAGTIIIDTPNTYLYLVLGGGKALRYGIGVGREGFTWSGREKISKMAEWPDWHPPKEMIDRQPYLPRFMAGGETNPLGARALYLGNTLYRIHGTNQPSTIGTFVSSGCIRLANADVEDLYGRVTVGTKVLVLPGKQPPETTASVR
jgi:lipoprotein-anchoring transpeptidase ErfK/SrfK